MESKRQFLTPRKRENDSSDVGSSKKMTPVSGSRSGSQSGSRRIYMLKILLPNGLTVMIKLLEGTELVTVKELANRVKTLLEKKISNPKKSINWDADLYFLDDFDRVYRDSIKLSRLELNKPHNFRLHDGSEPETIYENMWDLTPDTELLMELPEEYTFETALADLIDNSLQAVWTNDESERKLIRVEVSNDKISIFDTGPGMESIEKWGKMGASLHRALKTHAIGGKPPYLKPAFGMFGYGGFVASMHLGRETEVTSKTMKCKKVYMLRFKRAALVNGSDSKKNWTTYGGLRNPTEEELELSPAGSFTRVEIFEPKMRRIDIRRLQCKLKDIYFPYIQCDDLSKKGRTTRPIEFQINGEDLAEISGGEVAYTNLNSCNGPEFVLQLRFQLNHEKASTTNSPGARDEANARLRCVYLPVKEGKESIATLLESLKEDGYDCKEEFESFTHVSCRRLGRLLPDARWTWLPFMDLRHKKGDKAQVLKRSCMRVKCFIETDAGFSPTPSKTDFAHQSPFTSALKNLGSKQHSEKGVEIDIRKDGRPLTLTQLDKQYQQWLVEMHEKYDEDIDCGADEPVFILNPSNKRKLHVSNDVVRVHKVLRRKDKAWKSGMKIKILKGACAGFHNNNVYATLEYFLLEGFQGDTGGDAWIICRTIDIPEEDGCLLQSINEIPKIDLRKSVSIPINVIDSEKCVAVDDSEWSKHIKKQQQKFPSLIEILDSKQCRELGIKASLPHDAEVYAGDYSPCEIVAVVRPGNYKPGTASKRLDQKFVMKDEFEMTLTITFFGTKKSNDGINIYSGRVKPSSKGDFQGLYVFQPKWKAHPLFHKAGNYTFTFFIRDSSCEKCVVKVEVKPLDVQRWGLSKTVSNLNLTVGCSCDSISVSMFDKFENQLPFLKVPELLIEIKYSNETKFQVNTCNPAKSLDKWALIIQGLLIESSSLDNIRPTYDATMMLCQPDGTHLLDFPIKVFPGPVKSFRVQENFEKQLIPGQVIKEFTLELLDAYGNHVQEDEKVELSLNGFDWLGGSISSKVDTFGYIHLGGLIRVTAGYGRNVSLSICSNGERISKEWQIERRFLRSVSTIPESCFVGSQLENMKFEVVNMEGEVDVNFHDEDTIGQSHTLVIKSEFMDIDESVKYAFRQGRCAVRAIPVPFEEGEYSFVVAHSHYPELQLTVKVLVEQPQDMEPLNIVNLSTNEDIFPLRITDNTPIDYRSAQHYTPEINTSPLLNTCYSNVVETESCTQFQKDLENEIVEFAFSIRKHEENIELLNCQLREIESQLSQLEVCRDQTRSIHTYGSPTKNEIEARIESKTDTAAAFVLKLLKQLSSEFRRGVMGNIIGVVALLGTTPTFELSRIFAEYLGDQILGVVCKSYQDVSLLETYEANGQLNRTHALHMLARELGQSINGRYLVLCIEDIRACTVDKDLQGKLLLPDPTFPDGSTPQGFVGYAVNLIDIDVDHLNTKTDAGCGLRETLFYRLFGETQVYKTREHMKNAIPCIKDGAVSLDGGILRGNGVTSIGCLEPDIIFPVVPARNRVPSQRDMAVMRRHKELMLKRKETMDELIEKKKSLESEQKKLAKKRDKFVKYFARNQSVAASSQVSPMICLEAKPFATQGSYVQTQRL
ncbi:structural maintenance of chromosomes flexible hinge domain-containing protein GMI1 [Rutidosis leptorrhynchoides]|uniref:structural maintenance of chromosomes flexible hinge domain-containing protein GMI1 n=1 Tax=Rutidosis leptorrhynchoides TaxID=125765 RepID=UPI003A99B661